MKENFGSLVSLSKRNESSILLYLQKGQALVSGICSNAMRVRITPASVLTEDFSFSIEKKLPESLLAIDESGDHVSIAVTDIELRIDRSAFSITIADTKGTILSKGKPLQFDENTISDSRLNASAEDFFGLGERITPYGRRGYSVVNWNIDKPQHHNETDANLYTSFPFYISVNPSTGKLFGYFLDCSYKTEFDMGATDWNSSIITAHSPEYNLYVFAGSFQQILSTYTELTGRHPLPPLWSIGYHQCRWSYKSADEGLAIAEEFRKRKIPCDAIWYDIHFMDGYRVFTFDPCKFGNAKEVFAKTKAMGFHTVLIVDPGVKADDPEGVYEVNDEGNQNRFFIRNPDGSDYVGKVWPGLSKFPDFSRPAVRKWWGELHKKYYDKGADGFWNDMNEIADMGNSSKTVPPEVVMWDEGKWSAQDRMHNVYASLEAKATFDGMLATRPDERPFILTRAGFAGIQKYTAKWCGDNTSSWNHLKASIQQMINMGLSGFGFVGADVGGFGYTNSNPELLARWTQLGAFYPFFRNHAADGTIYQEPWRFGEETEKICRDAITLRYRLLPYFYQLFREMHLTGSPVFRPLFWNNPADRKALAISDEFLVGDYLLVAPVVERGETSRKVYFPEGKWYNYFTCKEYTGKSEHVIDAPLDTIPLFVKSGSIIPLMNPVESTMFRDKESLILKCVPSDSEVRLDLYEDDGSSNRYTQGKFTVSAVTLSNKGLTFVKGSGSSIKTLTVQIPCTMSKPKGFVMDGAWLVKQFTIDSGILRVDFSD